MGGSKNRLVAFGLTATVLAGLLIGWSFGLRQTAMVQQGEAVVFLALVLLFIVSLLSFVAELVRVTRDST